MLAAIASCWALLLGMGLLMLGSGLQGSLLGLRASMEGFHTATTGVVMSGYFIGFLVGSYLVPGMVRRVGHIRVFAALASLASITVLVHAVWIEPVSWMLVRLVTGFAYAGLFIVSESWLNDKSTNRTRGQLLSGLYGDPARRHGARSAAAEPGRSGRFRAIHPDLGAGLVRAVADFADRGAGAELRRAGQCRSGPRSIGSRRSA